jgi:uncharacterized protein (TIGR02996 family)
MSTPEVLLEAIRAHPADLSLRLIYADWLEEQGQPQAELIRLQCALEQLEPQDPRLAELLLQERHWLDEHQEQLLGPLPQLAHFWQIRRGMVEQVTVHVRDFLQHAETLVRAAPVASFDVVGELDSQSCDRSVRRLARLPWLERVTVLDLGHNVITSTGMQALARSPYLRNLRTLRLFSNLVADEGAQWLARCRALRRLLCLDLGRNMIGDEGLQALAWSRQLRRLRELELPGNSIRNLGLAALAQSPLLARLHILNLRANAIGDAGVVALAQSPHLDRLQGLDLSQNFLTDAGLAALAKCDRFHQLRGLSLTGNHFTEYGWELWEHSPYISRFRAVHRSPPGTNDVLG